MIDFHSHVLSGIDDGSRDIQTSIAILETSRKQGVSCMVATPHFYADNDRIDSFLENRARAMEQLDETIAELNLESRVPKLFVCSEVAYYPGISESNVIEKLTLEGTNILLLEMPFGDWRQSQVDEVYRLCEKRGFKVVLAHLERFMTRENKKYIKEVLDMSKSLPVYVQINAGPLTDWKQSRKLVKMFGSGDAHFLGSDCHGMHRRPPNMGDGMAVLEKKLGRGFIDELYKKNVSFLREAGLEL